MLIKIIFDKVGYSKSIEISSALKLDMDNVYNVRKSQTGFYIRKADGNIVAMSKKQYEDRYLDYTDKRRREYPNVMDQLDAIWKELDRLNVKSAMLNSIKAIKAKHPKK